MRGYTYIGTIDDMVERYPWQFKVTESYFNHALLIQLIDGYPILLNDGYLIQHPFGRAALLNPESLLWHLVRKGFVQVMGRGGDRYGLAEMPVRMAAQGIPSYQLLTADRIEGVSWSDLQKSLENLDGFLRERKKFVPWPTYDTGSGFRVFAEKLKSKNSTAHSLGIAKHVNSTVFPAFFDQFIDLISKDPSKPRTQWEHLAQAYADNPQNTNRPKLFLRAMMNLANETYHYNMGVMLAADHNVPVAVETQTSAAFDDLLITTEMGLSEADSYCLHVPDALSKVDPFRLVDIIEEGSTVRAARQEWFRVRAAAQSQPQSRADDSKKELHDAGRRYTSELAKLLGEHVKFEKSEGLFGMVVSHVFDSGLSAITAGIAGVLASPAGLPVAGMAAAVTGFLVSHLQKRMVGTVTKKVKIYLIKEGMLPDGLVQQSERILRRIKGRQVPSSIEISHEAARTLTAGMLRFKAT